MELELVFELGLEAFEFKKNVPKLKLQGLEIPTKTHMQKNLLKKM
jgi:hypothetical protein